MSKKKILLALSAVVFVAACGGDASEQQLFTSVIHGVKGLNAPAQAPLTVSQIRQRLTPEVRAQFGTAALKIALLEEKKQASVLIETGENLNVTTYFTPDGISISLQDGVLVATRGLGFDLMTADVSAVQSGLRNGSRAVRVHRYLDGEDQVVIKSFVCDYSGTTKVVETCYGNDNNFENRYSMVAGQIAESRQWIGPQLGYIVLEPS